jgi:hypothetical protein
MQCWTLNVVSKYLNLTHFRLIYCLPLYSVFRLKRNRSCNSICKLWWHQHNNTNGLFFSISSTLRSVSSVNTLSSARHIFYANTSCVPKLCYQSVYWLLSRSVLASISIAECFTASSKWFRCEVMFENEHAFCSFVHNVHTCTTGVSSGLANRGDLDSLVTVEVSVPQYVTVVGLRFRCYTLYNDFILQPGDKTWTCTFSQPLLLDQLSVSSACTLRGSPQQYCFLSRQHMTLKTGDTWMPRVGFELTTQLFENVKPAHQSVLQPYSFDYLLLKKTRRPKWYRTRATDTDKQVLLKSKVVQSGNSIPYLNTRSYEL